jgi:hypothetical protein
MERKVFISFALENEALALDVINKLLEKEIALDFATQISAKIISVEQQITNAYAVIVLFTDEALTSNKFEKEVFLLGYNNKNIIVLKCTKTNFNRQQKNIFANASVINFSGTALNEAYETLFSKIDTLRDAFPCSYSQRQYYPIAPCSPPLPKFQMSFKGRNEQKGREGIIEHENIHRQQTINSSEPELRTPKRFKLFSHFNRKHKKQTRLSLFAPSQLARGENMLVQIYLHFDNFTEQVNSKAFMRDENTKLRANDFLDTSLKYGDNIEVKLIVPKGIEIDEPIQKFVWQNDLKPIDFAVSIPLLHQLGDMIGTIIVSKDLLPICSVKFITKIVLQTEEKVSNAKTYSAFYKKVFVSYSSADREEVIKIAAGFKALHIDFFLDKLYLDGGDKYKEKIFKYIDKADLFLLCWSENAERSEWVKKEYSYALERINRPDMTLSIYPIIIKPKANPPRELNDYHFVEL